MDQGEVERAKTVWLTGKEKAIGLKTSSDNRGKMSKESLKGNWAKLGWSPSIIARWQDFTNAKQKIRAW
jgi:hypothetical protein